MQPPLPRSVRIPSVKIPLLLPLLIMWVRVFDPDKASVAKGPLSTSDGWQDCLNLKNPADGLGVEKHLSRNLCRGHKYRPVVCHLGHHLSNLLDLIKLF